MAAADVDVDVDVDATEKTKVWHNTQLLQTLSIPNDIIIDILSWLPAKSLLRLRWTCKYWFDLITRDHDFIKLHLHRSSSINPHNHSVLISSPLFPEDCHSSKYDVDDRPCMFYQSYVDSTNGFFSRRVKVPNIFQTFINFQILGSCNGLLFFSYDSTIFVEGTRLCIWNPCTKEYKRLPNPNTLDKLTAGSITFGFGYDHSIDDYKVIRNTIFSLPGNWGLLNSRIDVQVYTLGTDSWRNGIGSIPDNLITRNWKNVVFVNGALYWIDNWHERIFSFDIEKETYEEISNQPEYLHNVWKTRSLEIFEGSLCLILSSTYDLEMWMMKKESSWTQLLKIPRGLGDGNVNPLRLANGKIMLFDKPKHSASYDPKKNRTMTISKTTENEEYMLHRGERAEAIYIESLVSLKSGTYIVDELLN